MNGSFELRNPTTLNEHTSAPETLNCEKRDGNGDIWQNLA